jgi:predicted amino acid-binding ACT domain protein
MALNVHKTDMWVAELEDKPGALAACLGKLADAGANLECVIGRRQQGKPGKGLVFVAPLGGRKVRAAAKGAGFRANRRVAALRIEGVDRRGLGARIAGAVGGKGVNMRGTSAAVIGGRFVCYLGFDSKADAGMAAAAIRRMGD